MKQISLVIILFFNSSLLFSQEIKSEKIYQDCLYDSLKDKAVILKKYTKEFENHLIASKILKDSTPKAYFNLFKLLGDRKWRQFRYNYSYIDSINKITNYKTLNGDSTCIIAMREHKNFKQSKISKISITLLEREYKTVEAALKRMAEYLDEEDFELEFYKYLTLLRLEDLTGFGKIEDPKF